MNTDNNNQEIQRIIEAFLHGGISADERVRLQQWLSEDRNNKKYFRQMVLIWKATALYHKDGEDITMALEKTKVRILSSEEKPDRHLGGIFTRIPGLWKYAAAIVFSLVCGAVLSHFISAGKSSERFLAKNEVCVPLGSKTYVVLPDCTEVWLNAGSSLTYDFRYGTGMRDVELSGEGFFRVVKNKKIPFVVHTSGANIRALGTEFNVKAYPDENRVTTILVEGSVEVSKTIISAGSRKAKTTDSFILIPGQKLSFNKEYGVRLQNAEGRASDKTGKGIPEDHAIEINGFYLENINPDIETSWKEKRWIIKGEYLADLCVLLSRRYNISIDISDPTLAKFKFSGILQNETLEQVFEIMRLTIPIRYNIDKGKAMLELNPQLEKKYQGAYKTE